MRKAIIFITVLSLPAVAFGQGTGTLQSLIGVVGNIANILVSILSVFAFVVFFYGLAMFIFNSSDEEKTKDGKSYMFWGVIALFVLVTIWGIIGLLQRTVGNYASPNGVNIEVPTF